MDKTATACSNNIGVNTENTELASSLANLALISSSLSEEQAALLKAFALAAVTVLQQNQPNSHQQQQLLHTQQLLHEQQQKHLKQTHQDPSAATDVPLSNNCSNNNNQSWSAQCLNLATKSRRSRQQSLQTNTTTSSSNGSPIIDYLESHETHHQEDLIPEPKHRHNHHQLHQHLSNHATHLNNLHRHHLHHNQSYQDGLDGDIDSFDDTDDFDDTQQDDLNDQDDYDDDADDKEFSSMTHEHSHHNDNSIIRKDYDETEKSKQIIQEFAQELKQRRKYIRLSQKGAAQSLRAFTSGQQPCTDAIIYHFENLQMEPERALQLIPMLKDWLRWAEKQRRSGKTLDLMPAVSKVPRERKRKVVLFNEKAKQYLEDSFAKNNHPDRWQLDVISEELNIPTRSIRKWFTNRRQRKRFADKFSPVVPTGEPSNQMT